MRICDITETNLAINVAGTTKELKSLLASGKKLTDAWPDIEINGVNLLDAYMVWTDNLIARKSKNTWGGDAQEVYLGYSPKSKTFISGWDGVWEYEDDDDDSGHMVYKLMFDTDSNTFKGIPQDEHGSGIFYPTQYNAVHRYDPDLIDIRLD